MPKDSGIYECPSCFQPLVFRNPNTNIIVCKGCNTSIARLDGDVLAKKSMLILAFKNEVIQPGTTGIWNNQRFEVLGRVQYWFKESVFNYWTIVFNNGTLFYLAEGYGLYAILERIWLKREVGLAELQNLQYENTGIALEGDESYVLERRQSAFRLDLEGEVFIPDANSAVHFFEFSSVSGKRLNVLKFANNVTYACKAEYTEFAVLQLSNTRKEGYHLKEFQCTNCKNNLVIKTFPYAQSCSCNKCGSWHKVDSAMTLEQDGKNKKAGGQPYIPIGSRAIFKRYEYEVIGFTIKEERNEYKSQWREFVLHNPDNGYAFISEYDGNFIFVKETCKAPVLQHYGTREFNYDNEPFQLYNQYQFKIIESAGEFPNNIYNDKNILVREFISPPEMWILEKNDEEGINWFFAEHVTGSEIAKVFAAQLPPKDSAGAIEPLGYVSYRKLALLSFTMILLLLLVHFFLSFTMKNKVLIDTSYTLPDSLNTTTIITDKFELTKWKSNIELNIFAPVDNSWFELTGSLVNAKTGTEYAFEQGVEYYAGYSEGESWTEGDHTESVYLSSIPEGTYFLQLAAIKERAGSISHFDLTVTNDVPMAKNVLIILGLLLLWPLIKYYIVQNNEKKRWSNSPFTPYKAYD